MPNITPRLSVEGPDIRGIYEIAISECGDTSDGTDLHFLTRAEADAIIAALNPWRDIASAPKDGTPIRVYFKRIGAWDVRWTSLWSDDPVKDGLWHVPGDNKNGEMPLRGYAEGDDTHWQPLPAAPVAAGKAQT